MPQNPFANVNLATATDEELTRLKAATDDQLLRATGTPDLFSVVESSRRLRAATTTLTWVLIGLTLILVVLTGVLVWLGFEVRDR
jgi:hypothetical protein